MIESEETDSQETEAQSEIQETESQETKTESQSSKIDLQINEDIPVPIIIDWCIDVNRSVFHILLKVSIKSTKEKQEKLTFYNMFHI